MSSALIGMVLIGYVLATGQAAVGAQDSQAQPETVTEKPIRVTGRIELYIPPPIGDEELEEYATVLELSDGQRHFLKFLYERYKEADQEVRTTDIQALVPEASRLAMIDDDQEDPQVGAQKQELWKSRNRAVDRLKSVEMDMWNELQDRLADFQVELLPRVLRHRSRERSGIVASLCPGGGVDLNSLLGELSREGSLIYTDEPGFEAQLLQYEIEITPLFERKASERVQGSMNESTLLANMRREFGDESFVLPVENQPTAWQERWRELRRLRGRPFQTEKLVAAINERYLVSFAQCLAPATAKELTRRYKNKVYPAIYPDPFDLEPLIDDLLQEPNFSEDQKLLLNEILAGYMSRRNTAASEMETAFSGWKEIIFVEPAYEPSRSIEYRDRMDVLQESRKEAALTALKQIREAFPQLDHQVVDRIATQEQSFADKAKRAAMYR